MATEQQARDLAKKKPADRTPAEQAIVDQHRGSQAVRNLDHEAKRQQRIHGPG
jgi:hypothetical protein